MNIIINEQSKSDLGGGVIFEAEISKVSSMNPKISFWENQDGSITLNLHLWDSKEVVDGYGLEEAQELVATLSCAIEYVKSANSDDGQLELFGDENNGQV